MKSRTIWESMKGTQEMSGKQPKRQVISVAVNALQANPINPPSRVQMNEPLVELKRSMAEDGQLVPILIGSDNRIKDGHKRWTCAKELGWEKIDAIVVDVPDATVYRAVNCYARPLRPTEWLVVHLRGGEVPTEWKEAIDFLEATVGRAGIEKMAERGQSPSIVEVAFKMARYTARSNTAKLAPDEALHWLFRHNLGWRIKRAIDAGVDPEMLYRAVHEDKPLVYTFGLGT